MAIVNSSTIKQLFRSEVFKHSTTLLSSNVISQGITLLAYPIIARIYKPDIFGEVAYLISLASILTVLATGNYEAAIILPKSNSKAKSIFQLTVITNITVAALAFIIIATLKNQIFSFLKYTNSADVLLLIPYLIFILGLWYSIRFYYVRLQKFKLIGVYNVMQGALNAFLKIWFGLKGFVNGGMVWAPAIAQSIAIITVSIIKKNKIKNILKINWREIKEVAIENKDFPKYKMPINILNALAGSLPILLLSIKFEMTQVGLFAMAMSVGFSPINLFFSSMYPVLYNKSVKSYHAKRLYREMFYRFYKICFITVLPLFIIFVFTGEWLFGFIFGEQWAISGFYLKFLLPWMFVLMLNGSIDFIPLILEKQRKAMIFEVLYFVTRFIAIIIGILLSDFTFAIILYSIAATTMAIVINIWYMRLIIENEKTQIQNA